MFINYQKKKKNNEHTLTMLMTVTENTTIHNRDDGGRVEWNIM